MKTAAETKNFHINYIKDSISIDPSYMDNEARLGEIRDFLRFLRDNDGIRLDSIKFAGTASPDGYIERNEWLSRNRLEQFKALVREEYNVPDSIIFRNDNYITWERLRKGVEASDIPYREEVLEVLSMPADTVRWYRNMHTDNRLLELRTMHNGQVWTSLKPILDEIRYAEAEFVFHYALTHPREVPQLTIPVELPTALYLAEPAEESLWVRRLYLKTNLIDWGMLIANAAVEVDIARHWSFALPLYYSCWDYFTPKLKFRIAGLQPEIRYWFNPEQNDGWFIGGHFGLAWYNMAFNGDYRYQDRDGRTPTTGGGLAVGWRKQFGHNNHWRLEFSVGAGVYPLDYDVFENTHDYKDGRLVDQRKKTFIGLDQAAITIGYAFDLNKTSKKGGKK